MGWGAMGGFGGRSEDFVGMVWERVLEGLFGRGWWKGVGVRVRVS